MVVKIHIVVFWVMTLCGLVGGFNILKEHTVSIFRVEHGDCMLPQNTDIDLSDYMCFLHKLMMPVISVAVCCSGISCKIRYTVMW
jgi:hypothetical protein